MSEKSLYEKIEGRNIIVYGAGFVGKAMIGYLRDSNVVLRGIADRNDKLKDEFKQIGLDVCPIEVWKELEPDATILLAVGEKYQEQLLDNCKAVGFNNIITISDEDLQNAIRWNVESYLRKKNVSTDGEYLSFGKMKVLNALKFENRRDQYLYLTELCDFILPTQDENWNIINEGPYDWGNATLEHGDVVFDCGANMGLFSTYAAVQKGCICYAFEPFPELKRTIEKMCEVNGVSINLVSAAVSNATGVATFSVGYNNTAGSLVKDAGKEGAIKVQTISIDEFVEKEGLSSVDYIKADIEGAERLMLQGAQNTLAKFGPKLAICTYHLPDDKEVLTKLILQANPRYQIEYKWQKLYASIPEDSTQC